MAASNWFWLSRTVCAGTRRITSRSSSLSTDSLPNWSITYRRLFSCTIRACTRGSGCHTWSTAASRHAARKSAFVTLSARSPADSVGKYAASNTSPFGMVSASARASGGVGLVRLHSTLASSSNALAGSGARPAARSISPTNPARGSFSSPAIAALTTA